MRGNRSSRDRSPRVKAREAWLLSIAHEEEPRFGPGIPWKLSLSSEARDLFVGSYVSLQRGGTTLEPGNTCYMTIRQLQESSCPTRSHVEKKSTLWKFIEAQRCGSMSCIVLLADAWDYEFHLAIEYAKGGMKLAFNASIDNIWEGRDLVLRDDVSPRVG